MKRYALLAHWKPEKFLIERKRVWRFTFIAWAVYTIRALGFSQDLRWKSGYNQFHASNFNIPLWELEGNV